MLFNFTEMAKQYNIEANDAPLSHSLVREALATYNRPNDKINSLVQKGELIALRRGLYVNAPSGKVALPNSFLIANHLRGPSYVSLESALSHWNMIPERVYEISSVTLKTSKTYKTPLGRFGYYHLAFPYYSFGVNHISFNERQAAMVASPEKALCDKIILTSGVQLRSRQQTIDFLLEDMRLDEDLLKKLNLSSIASWIEDAAKKSSLEMLITTINDL